MSQADLEKDSERHHRLWIPDFLLGASDGCVTTFSIISGSEGAGFTLKVALTLGLANLLSDGVSMAVAQYQAQSSIEKNWNRVRATEERLMTQDHQAETRELVTLFSRKGFSSEAITEILRALRKNPNLWIETMLVEEHGLSKTPPHSGKSAFTTFLAFQFGGGLPLLLYFLAQWIPALKGCNALGLTTFGASLLFLCLGYFKEHQAPQLTRFKGAAGSLLQGLGASWIAFAVGKGLN